MNEVMCDTCVHRRAVRHAPDGSSPEYIPACVFPSRMTEFSGGRISGTAIDVAWRLCEGKDHKPKELNK